MDNCIFCKIIKKDIPAEIVYEDPGFMAFLDIQPVSDGHLLIIPKKHIEWMQDADDDTIAGMYRLAKRMIIAMKTGLVCDYVQLSVVGKDVPHFHVHLIPRYFNDGLIQYPTSKYRDGGASKIAEKIREVI